MVLAAAAAGDQYEYASMCIHIPIYYTRYIQIYTSQIYYSYTGLFMIYVRIYICTHIYIYSKHCLSSVCVIAISRCVLDVSKVIKIVFYRMQKKYAYAVLSFIQSSTHTHCTATKGGQFQCLRSTQN